MKRCTLFAGLCVFCFTLTAVAGKGQYYPPEWRVLPALVSHYEVVQLTNSTSTDSKMYLNVDPFVPALKATVFMSRRDGNSNLYLLSLVNGGITQVTASKILDAAHANVATDAALAFYREVRTIKSVNLYSPFVERKIYEFSSSESISGTLSTTSDGRKLAVALYREKKKDSIIGTIDVATKAFTEVYKSNGRIDHVMINPVYYDHLLYHVFEGDVAVANTKTSQGVIIGHETKSEHVVHPFWFPDGITAAYVLKYTNQDNETREKIITYNTQTKEYGYYKINPRGNHFAVNPATTFLQNDGEPKDKSIYYYPLKPGNDQPVAIRMFAHNSSSSDELWHPHGVFINDTDLLFNSDMGGKGNVYLLRKK